MLSNRMEILRQDLRRRVNWLRITGALSVGAVIVAIMMLKQTGIAVNTKTLVLDCPVTERVAHTHDESCYDEDGNLVCLLDELELHTHDDSCYRENTTLICGLEEGEGSHTHDDTCYDKNGELICELEESEGHVHDDTCYETERELVCEQEEITVQHQHTRDCFKEVENTAEPTYPEQTFMHEFLDNDNKLVMRVDVHAPEGALPENSVMKATWVDENKVSDKVLEAVNTSVTASADAKVLEFQAVDIAFFDAAGNEVEPLCDVEVTFTSGLASDNDVMVVHLDDISDTQQETFDKTGVEPDRVAEVRELVSSDVDVSQVTFESNEFSTYFLTKVSVETESEAELPDTTVTVKAPASAGIAKHTEVNVSEISDDSSVWATHLSELSHVCGFEPSSVRMFDISLLNDGKEVQPSRDSSVNVSIKLTGETYNDPVVVHFGNSVEIVDSSQEETSDATIVRFDATGFSIYAIVDAPEPVPPAGANDIASLSELIELGGQGLYVHNPNGYYMTAGTYSPSAGRNGILKTKPAASSALDTESAVKYYFELVDGTTNYFNIYCYDGGNKKYVRQSANSLIFCSTVEPTTNTATCEFVVEPFPGQDSTFRIVGVGDICWNMQGNNGGNGFCAYNGRNDTNARLRFEYYDEVVNDPYKLHGKTYGIAYNNDAAVAIGMLASTMSSNDTRLNDLSMAVRPDVLDNSGLLLVSDSTDLAEWTFENVTADNYKMSTIVDGQRKYLGVNDGALCLYDTYDEINCLVRVTTGVDEYAGKWRFIIGDKSVTLMGNAGSGFGLSKTVAKSWLNLVEKSVLTDDDFVVYSAKKVSVSDKVNVYTGKKVVVYTRIWNDTTKRYEFYAIDHSNNMVRVYDSGDTVSWVGSKVNSVLWDFTEYLDDDNNPNHYYELRNVAYNDYLAPQQSSNQIISQSPIGLNLNGRRYGLDYTTLIAWDEYEYSYSGLKYDNGKLVPCALSEANDFYFAVFELDDSEDEDDELTTVKTIDNTDYGITMKMVDFNNPIVNNRDSVQNDLFGGDNNVAGLLSPYLDDNGYPVLTASTGHAGTSLLELFGESSDANNLFIKSVYEESGYFEYDSTQNFAHLNDNGKFTVYDQIAAIGTSNGRTRTHGQFMPYNVITAGNYAPMTNQTDVLGNKLSDLDPRKGEKLYAISNEDADYFFGMEMTASFTQTPSGEDAWGHDIIFEFSGDDDFWLYVDDNSVIDLGGVHSASIGSINFKTGEVIMQVRALNGSSVSVSRSETTTLRAIFERNYRATHDDASDADVTAYLDGIFDPGTSVFTEYTDHTMRLFYMERGAGASNLKMRFNLASVKPGTFVLSKTLSGTDSASNDLLEFPYQIYYYDTSDAETIPHRLGVTAAERNGVLYAGSKRKVKYANSFTPAGGDHAYSNVFFLKPGESAEVMLPKTATRYYVVECGINGDVYDEVKVNGVAIEGRDSQNLVGQTVRQDFVTSDETLEARSKVNFDNHVDETAVRSIMLTKRLYDSDGETVLTHADDSAKFAFRLYLGDESTAVDDIPEASVYSYYVRNENMEYCRWDANTQDFVSLGVTTHDDLLTYFETNHWTSAQKETVIFKTSMYGAISKIPAGYTVEVRDIIAGTRYAFEERDSEIPRGYTMRVADGYTSVVTNDSDEIEYVPNYDDDLGKCIPISGVVMANDDPHVEIRNQRGWGLTVEKFWTDRDFMESHDSIYFGIYLNDELVDGTLRELPTTATELYYFLPDLKDDLGTVHNFSEYTVREVQLTGAVVDGDGYVTSYDTIDVLDDGDVLLVSGVVHGDETHTAVEQRYTVSYEVGHQTTENANIRTDTVTNSRPGIAFYKRDFENNIVVGAEFTLTTETGWDVAKSSYVSDNTGLITIAYLPAGRYLLNELAAPSGFSILESPLEIVVTDSIDGQNISVEGLDPKYYSIEENTDGMHVVIKIKDTPSTFAIKKVDADTDLGMEDVHFSLYRQVTNNDGELVRDYLPMRGYEDLSTDANGILFGIDMESLSIGTYYLHEISTLPGYAPLTDDICFSLGSDGIVRVETSQYANWLHRTEDDNGNVSYVLRVENSRSLKNVKMRKVDVLNYTSVHLSGAKFDMYGVTDGVIDETPMYTNLVSGSDGWITYQGIDTFVLDNGDYALVETVSPAGYELNTEPIMIHVGYGGVTYDDGTAVSEGNDGVSYDEDTDVYSILVTNATAYMLPATGGNGLRNLYVVLGMIASGLAGAYLLRRVKRHCFVS